jgi:prolipoprotein diacylglyceryltransferase
VPWGVSQYGVRRHPVQIYEIIAGLLALSTWWLLLPRRHYVGQLFLSAITLYSAARLLLDAFRDNTWLLADGYHGWQVLSFIVMIAGLILLARNAQTLEPPT